MALINIGARSVVWSDLRSTQLLLKQLSASRQSNSLTQSFELTCEEFRHRRYWLLFVIQGRPVLLDRLISLAFYGAFSCTYHGLFPITFDSFLTIWWAYVASADAILLILLVFFHDGIFNQEFLHKTRPRRLFEIFQENLEELQIGPVIDKYFPCEKDDGRYESHEDNAKYQKSAVRWCCL